ncbi:5584_t:CDS:1, partial [Dentiscutata heterogama]
VLLPELHGSLLNRLREPSLNKLANSIREHLKAIEEQISGLQKQLAKVIESFSLVQESANYARKYLIGGEREAEEALKKHWTGIIIDPILRKRVESELKEVRFIIKVLQNMDRNLINFNEFLHKYRRELGDISSNVQAVRKIPTNEDIKYLENAVVTLKKHHAKFSSAEEQLEFKPIDSSYFDINNPRNIECTEFTAMIDKPNNAYLKRIRIWSSDMINAIGFFYSDDTYDIYGAPGDDDPYDFDWHKGEKIKHILVRIEAVLYAIQFHTDRGRVSEWSGSDKGKPFLVYSHLPSIGIHGSFSRQICSIGITALF